MLIDTSSGINKNHIIHPAAEHHAQQEIQLKLDVQICINCKKNVVLLTFYFLKTVNILLH